MRALQAMGSAARSMPSTVMEPESYCRMPATDLRVVVLPAPLWPMKP